MLHGDAPVLRVRATVVVCLAEQDDFDIGRSDHRALDPLERVPDGAHVLVLVGSRRMPSQTAAGLLRQAAARLDVEIQSFDPEAVRSWRAAILTGRAL